ncbi:hypothetical protein BB558_005602 [Smittium angustum]|uniref:Uncharacterized protein n=1 Tax=Smittium angustum TaxID=133377 RepID=A0A2U1IZZ3_SMIAN|nr:hypothetical protein BB558_005602 [Smittium angustum]
MDVGCNNQYKIKHKQLTKKRKTSNSSRIKWNNFRQFVVFGNSIDFKNSLLLPSEKNHQKSYYNGNYNNRLTWLKYLANKNNASIKMFDYGTETTKDINNTGFIKNRGNNIFDINYNVQMFIEKEQNQLSPNIQKYPHESTLYIFLVGYDGFTKITNLQKLQTENIKTWDLDMKHTNTKRNNEEHQYHKTYNSSKKQTLNKFEKENIKYQKMVQNISKAIDNLVNNNSHISVSNILVIGATNPQYSSSPRNQKDIHDKQKNKPRYNKALKETKKINNLVLKSLQGLSKRIYFINPNEFITKNISPEENSHTNIQNINQTQSKQNFIKQNNVLVDDSKWTTRVHLDFAEYLNNGVFYPIQKIQEKYIDPVKNIEHDKFKKLEMICKNYYNTINLSFNNDLGSHNLPNQIDYCKEFTSYKNDKLNINSKPIFVSQNRFVPEIEDIQSTSSNTTYYVFNMLIFLYFAIYLVKKLFRYLTSMVSLKNFCFSNY